MIYDVPSGSNVFIPHENEINNIFHCFLLSDILSVFLVDIVKYVRELLLSEISFWGQLVEYHILTIFILRLDIFEILLDEFTRLQVEQVYHEMFDRYI